MITIRICDDIYDYPDDSVVGWNEFSVTYNETPEELPFACIIHGEHAEYKWGDFVILEDATNELSLKLANMIYDKIVDNSQVDFEDIIDPKMSANEFIEYCRSVEVDDLLFIANFNKTQEAIAIEYGIAYMIRRMSPALWRCMEGITQYGSWYY